MKKDRLQILISCMHQKDHSIIADSDACADVVVVNQCDREESETFPFTDPQGKEHNATFISTTQRGLSRSRNMAIRNATAEFCLIADDDEVFEENLSEAISEAFDKHPDSDLLIFSVKRKEQEDPEHREKKDAEQEKNIGYIGALHVASCQIAFRRKSIIDAGITFQENMGSGTGNGAGEENKFLYDCLRKKLRITYVPLCVATLSESFNSQWFSAWDKKFFINRGWQTKQFMGHFFATLYAVFYAVRKHRMYRSTTSLPAALYYSLKGIYFTKR